LLVFALLVVSAAGASQSQSTWGPADSVHALDGVIAAVSKLAATPGLSHDKAAHVQQVAADVKKEIEEVENNKNLTKSQAHEKVGKAMQQLMGLEGELQKVQQNAEAADKMLDQNSTVLNEKLAEMQKELGDKKAALAKDESMIKLYNLQKELIEKKLKLQKLLDQRSQGKDTKKQQVDEGKQEADMVTKVLAAAGDMKAKSELPAPLKAVLVDLKGRESKLAEQLEKDAASEAKYEASLDKELKSETSAKQQHMIKSMKAEEKRKFRKADASKKIELGEIKEAEASIEKRDLAALSKVMNKMKAQSNALQAKSGDFLH